MGGSDSYVLGIDLGTTYTAAATWRNGRAQMANLGTRSPVVPSVLFLRDDAELLYGEAADRRAHAEPRRVVREFKRRVGDSTPIILGGTPFAADALMAKLARWVVDTVSETEGQAPAGITITHPANWGAYKQDLLHQAVRNADLDDVQFVTEPEAAAIHYASQERIDPGAVVAVYDLGGGTFDSAVLSRTGTGSGWEVLGPPEGIERLGGIDFDEAVFQHVLTAIGWGDRPLDEAGDNETDEQVAARLAALHRLRRDCVVAKEALSADTDTAIQVMLPDVQTQVRLTRAELEEKLRPTLHDSVATTARAFTSAGVEPQDVHSVLLVGGSSRIPLVAELLTAEFARPVALDAHPKHGTALGAALVAATGGTADGTADDGEPDRAAGGATNVGAAGAVGAAAADDTGPSADSGSVPVVPLGPADAVAGHTTPADATPGAPPQSVGHTTSDEHTTPDNVQPAGHTNPDDVQPAGHAEADKYTTPDDAALASAGSDVPSPAEEATVGIAALDDPTGAVTRPGAEPSPGGPTVGPPPAVDATTPGTEHLAVEGPPPQPENEGEGTPRRRFYLPVGALIVVAVVLLGLAGQRWLRPASSGGDPPDTVVPDEPGTTTTTTLDQIEIPDVLDQPRDEAEQAFDNLVGEAGTEIDVEFEYEADTVPTDDPGLDEHIAAQDPEAGETVSPEGDILVTLTLYGFEEPTTTLPPTTTGNPQGNGNEHHNTTTTHPVTTTTAPHTTPVPHVVGQHVDTARVNVEEAGFVPHISSSCVGDNCVVTAQNPAGGASAPAGSTVTLTAEDEIPDLEAP